MKPILVTGGIHIDREKNRMVEILKFIYAEKEGSRFIGWMVKDLLTCERYTIKEIKLSCEPLGEMEVLAWASK